MKQVAVIQNDLDAGLGNIAPVLDKFGFQVDVYHAYRESIEHLLGQDPDLLIVLGGKMSAFEIEDYPFLQTEMQLIKQRILDDKPLLGICLGPQLISQALGGKVSVGKSPEVGWYELMATHDKTPKFLQALFKNEVKLIMCHCDTFTLPKNATLHARTVNYENHLFTIGDNCLGIQAHPEADWEMFSKWIKSLLVKNLIQHDIEKIRKETECHLQLATRAVTEFWEDWLQHVRLVQ